MSSTVCIKDRTGKACEVAYNSSTPVSAITAAAVAEFGVRFSFLARLRPLPSPYPSNLSIGVQFGAGGGRYVLVHAGKRLEPTSTEVSNGFLFSRVNCLHLVERRGDKPSAEPVVLLTPHGAVATASSTGASAKCGGGDAATEPVVLLAPKGAHGAAASASAAPPAAAPPAEASHIPNTWSNVEVYVGANDIDCTPLCPFLVEGGGPCV